MGLTSAETFISADCRSVSLRRAAHADQAAVTTLLRDSNLPIDGVAQWLDRFWVAEHQGRVVGIAGMEHYGDSGLLRSVAVTQEWRGTGIGRTLVERVLEEGRAAGVREVYLLTTTAEHYFPRLGFGCVDRESVPAALRASAEFKGACPASAVVMCRTQPITRTKAIGEVGTSATHAGPGGIADEICPALRHPREPAGSEGGA